jgi:hypothetical protein
MTIQQAAAKVRAALKREGIDPRGKVSVRNTDCYSELTVELRWIPQEARDRIGDVLDSLTGNFTVSVE